MEEVLDKIQVQEDDPSIFTANNGVVIKLKRVNRMIVLDAVRQIQDPKPPVQFIEDKGRTEENPNDPDYIAAKQQSDFDRGMLTINVYLTFGTQVVSIPDGMYMPETHDWSEDLESLGMKIAPKGRARYASWLKYYALNEDEVNELSLRAMRFAGVTLEVDTAAAVDTFQGN